MKSSLLAATAACMVGTAHAFAVLPPNRAATALPHQMTTTPPIHSHGSSLSFSLTPLEEVLSDSSLLKDELCNGMTHALLDFSSVLGGANKVRMAAVLGRLWVIGQDVQHDVLPDELYIQVGLLAVACHGLLSALVPKWTAQLKAQLFTPALMTGQDRQAYRSLFRPAGVSWLNFKELHAEAMDWVKVEPGHVLLTDKDDDEDSVYWLYEGDVQVWSHDKISHNIAGRQEVAGLGLLGEGRLANILDSSSNNNSNDTPKQSSNSAGLKAVAGQNGATLLRMNTSKLENLLRHDQDLTHAIQRLAFMGMQDKLDALLLKEATP